MNAYHHALRALFVLLLMGLVAGCGDNADTTDTPRTVDRPAMPVATTGDSSVDVANLPPINETASGPEPQRHSSWQLKMHDKDFAGQRAFVGAGDGRLAIHLVNEDGVNLYLVVPDDLSPERVPQRVFFTVGRGQSCQLWPVETAFIVNFESAVPGWLNGSFAGQVACEDYSAYSISGRFSVIRAAQEQGA